MRTIIIKTPIWNKRSVGIAEYKITDNLQIKIDYKDRFGNLVYPENYFISKTKALTYPTIRLKNGLILREIPIDDLEIAKFKFGKN